MSEHRRGQSNSRITPLERREREITKASRRYMDGRMSAAQYVKVSRRYGTNYTAAALKLADLQRDEH